VGVIIGMDPHKRPATIEVIDEQARVLAAGKYGTDKAGYAQMLAAARTFADRVWAVEGRNGIGRHLAHRLVHDGETVFDVPRKLSAQVRVLPSATAARPMRPVRPRSRWPPCALRAWSRSGPGEDLVVMGMLADRRDELGRARTQVINRLHRLLLELLPGGAKKFLSARQTRTLLPPVKPRDLAGKTRRRLAAELISELEAIDKKTRALDKELTGLVTGRGPAAEPDQGPRLLRRPPGWRDALDDGHARPQATPVQRGIRRMLADQKRREASPGGQSGTPAGSSVTGQDPGNRPFGQATSRTRHSTA
jgi:transposase